MYVLYKKREIPIHENSWLFKFPILKNFEAITLGSFYFKHEYDELTIKHELVHINQIIKNGKIGFYLKYVWYFLENLIKGFTWTEAYYLIPFEIEAYKTAESVKNYRIVK